MSIGLDLYRTMFFFVGSGPGRTVNFFKNLRSRCTRLQCLDPHSFVVSQPDVRRVGEMGCYSRKFIFSLFCSVVTPGSLYFHYFVMSGPDVSFSCQALCYPIIE